MAADPAGRTWIEVGLKTQQLLASLDQTKKGSKLDMLNKIYAGLKQLRGMQQKEVALREEVTFPTDSEEKDWPPLVKMWLASRLWLLL